MVLLVTSDNEQFNTEKEIVERSVLIKNMLEGAQNRPPRVRLSSLAHVLPVVQMSEKAISPSLFLTLMPAC